MGKYSTVIVGGGAAGICAAISAARRGESVIICEKMSRLGKKILVTGNGRCNLLNDDMSEVNYNSNARDLVRSIFGIFGKIEILDFFKGIGLEVYSREGRIFPVTNQASSVLRVLEIEFEKLSVSLEYNFDCTGFIFLDKSIQLVSKAGKTVEGRKIIITAGGKTFPITGSDGSMYELAAQFGHTLVEPVPSGVPLVVKDPLCPFLQGQRIFARARSIVNGKRGEYIDGELLFTKYGLSGTCILDISEEISVAMNRHRFDDVYISLDLVPLMSKDQLKLELKRRRDAKFTLEDMLVGILPNKFGIGLKNITKNNDLNAIVNSLKDKRFKVNGTRGWDEAEFTCGGINVNEVNLKTLESKLKKGIYFAGEILDVNGKRGGYNLGWAWASGYVAGSAN
jgi:predicted Rossmann fold flavoprotein